MRHPQATSKETVIYAFQGGEHGANPQAGLIADAGGALYGTTAYGGSRSCPGNYGQGCGTVFELTPARRGYTERVLHAFEARSDGADPVAGLFVDATGEFYGSTFSGGTSSNGTAFKLTPTGAGGYKEKVLHAFLCEDCRGGRDGGRPAAGFIADAGGALYSTTFDGGAGCPPNSEGCGTVFKLAPTSAGGFKETVLYAFEGGSDGVAPLAGLIADATGALYGTTEGGGTPSSYCCGTVFKLAPNKGGYAESLLYVFRGGSDGAYPPGGGGLIADKSGALYGTTSQGGGDCSSSGGCGIAFKLTPKKSAYTESVICAFRGGDDGSNPVGGLIADAAGALYGTTSAGGRSGAGTVFKLTPERRGYRESVVYAFRGGDDGSNPAGGLITDTAGALYGTTTNGGRYDGGTVFKITP